MEQSKYEASILRDEAKLRYKKAWSTAVIAGLFFVAIGFCYFAIWQPQQVVQTTIAKGRPVERLFVPPVSTPEIEPAEAKYLGETAVVSTEVQVLTLNESNDIAVAALGDFYAGNEWLQWVATDEVLRKFVVVIDNIADGKVAHKYISIPKPVQGFAVEAMGEKEYLMTENYARYNHYLEIFDAIDVDLMASTYRQFSVLLEQAYAELGYPDRTFHSTMLRAIDSMLDTPSLPEGEIELIHTSVVYKYADAELESLSPLHKQILRMGPRNMSIAQKKLQAVKAALVVKP